VGAHRQGRGAAETPGLIAFLRRRRAWLLGAAVLLAILALRVALWRPLALAGEPPRDGLTRLSGAVHVHTTLSDGGGAPEEVVAAAQRAGLDFVVITDHNNLDAKAAEGYRGRLLVVVGTEVSTTVGHVLGVGIPDPQFRFSGDGLDALDDIRDLGGVAFAAHPVSARPDFAFSGWDLPGGWGVELLNGDSQWRAAGWGRLVTTALLYGLNHRYALLHSLTPPQEALARWDRLLARRDAAGIVGADAHSRVPIGRTSAVRFPSYESLLGLAQNHVLLDSPPSGDAARDARRLCAALGAGRSYVGLDALAPAGEFSFRAESSGRAWGLGDTVPPGAGLRLKVGGRMPAGTRITLLRDGRPLAESTGSLDVEAPGAGIYRVEARVPGVDLPWILTNPVYVFDAAAAAERAGRGAWPEAPAPPAAVATIDDFEDGVRFGAEHDSESAIEEPVLDRGSGVGGSQAGRLRFRLAHPRPEHPFVWCSLVNRESRDLSGRQGLVFSIRGDGVYRIFAQVRDANPASADDGVESWYGSVRTGTEWRRVALPFARFRSLNKRSDGKLDLDKVRQMVFVLDQGAVKPGTSGTIWIDDFGAY
jgi:hypothetical protein